MMFEKLGQIKFQILRETDEIFALADECIKGTVLNVKSRDENSLRHFNMSNEKISKEHIDAVEWFISRLGKHVEIVSNAKSE